MSFFDQNERNSFDSELKFHPVQNQIVQFKLVEKALDDGGSKFMPFMITGPRRKSQFLRENRKFYFSLKITIFHLELGEKGGRLKFTEERHFLNGVEIQGRRQGKLIDGKIYIKAGFLKFFSVERGDI